MLFFKEFNFVEFWDIYWLICCIFDCLEVLSFCKVCKVLEVPNFVDVFDFDLLGCLPFFMFIGVGTILALKTCTDLIYGLYKSNFCLELSKYDPCILVFSLLVM